MKTFSLNPKRWSALIGLILYVVLGLFTPESLAALTLVVDGPHALTIQADARGNESLVLHHHDPGISKAAENQFHHRHPDKPDHKILLSKTDASTFIAHENRFARSFEPTQAVLIGFLLMVNPLTGQKTALPQLYAHPPPSSQALRFRQTIALLL
ncbi:hypothetical protein [Vampirovibrio chlorellavorus]|uniref:hypothetical protein n=1 Tax=Vampirovibrio chlorellavorus TaxID=758823 RepID=UPI0026ED4F6B|nr:hypothetical protein [Vampirovibrio chlorellavorus]